MKLNSSKSKKCWDIIILLKYPNLKVKLIKERLKYFLDCSFSFLEAYLLLNTLNYMPHVLSIITNP